MRLLRSEPTLIASAIRLSILAAVGFGLDWTTEQVVGLMAAVEAWMAVYARANVTPEVKVVEREREALAAGASAGRLAAQADLLEIAAAGPAQVEVVQPPDEPIPVAETPRVVKKSAAKKAAARNR